MANTKSMSHFIHGRWQDNLPPEDTSLMIADPVYGSADVADLVNLAVHRRIPSCIFMMPLEIWGLPHQPHQVMHWVKPVSTKNTKHRYSNFVEVIAGYWLDFHSELHWSNRTGVFTDHLLVQDHKWKKPDSIIERLLRNHWPKYGSVYDPCAGSGTVANLCERLGIPSFSVELGFVELNSVVERTIL